MNDFFIELDVQGIKQHAKVARSCIFKDECVIKSRLGRLVLDLSDIGKINGCDIVLRRISGNGDLIIESIDSSSYHNVASKNRYIASIFPFPSTGKIEIQRPNASRGDVALIGVKCYLDKEEYEKKERENTLSNNWKKMMKRCGKYSGLRLAKGRLFASHGGFIENSELIERIQTNPKNMHSIKGNRMVFLGSCEIVDLLLSADAPIRDNSPLYANRRGPTPENILLEPPEQPKTTKTSAGRLFTRPKNKAEANQYQELLIYDSASLGQFSNSLILSNKLVKTVKSNAAEYVVLKRGGNFFIPMAALEQDMEYVVAITSKKMSGNGRIHIGFVSERKGVAKNSLQNICGNELGEQFVSVSTGRKTAPNQQFYLNLSMREDGSGESIISRIRVLRGMKAFHSGFENDYVSLPTDNIVSDTSILGNVDIGYPTSDSIFLLSKKYSRLITVSKSPGFSSEVRGSIFSSTISGMQWVNKIRRICPGINHVKAEDLIGENTVGIGSIKNIPKAKIIWLEEFDSDALTHQAIDTLQKAKTVHCLSLPNAQLLREYCHSEVKHTPRLIPFIPPKPIPYFKNKKYILSFNRNHNIARRVSESWTTDIPKIVMVGLRGRMPNHIMPVNEYLPYDELLFLLSNAQCILDLHGANKDYTSGFLDIAHYMGKIIVTNNWFGIDKKNCIFSVSNDQLGADLLPAPENLNKDIKKALAQARAEKNDMSKYNEKVVEVLRNLF